MARHPYAPLSQLQVMPGPDRPVTFIVLPMQSMPQVLPALHAPPP
jgi:hypothetical protein